MIRTLAYEIKEDVYYEFVPILKYMDVISQNYLEDDTTELESDILKRVSLEEGNEGTINYFHIGNLKTTAEFVPNVKQNSINIEELSDVNKLVDDFYVIDATTMAGSELLDVKKFLSYDMSLSKDNNREEPQILIYHTHSQEGFVDSISGDASTTIVGVGENLSNILSDEYGYNVLHHTGKYDVETRDTAYSNALPEIEAILKQYPSIEVVIDLHRDEMPKDTRLVLDLNGKPTARFMFFNGLSRTKNTGEITYLKNDYLEENLAFSFQMQMAANEYYPGLARKIYLKGYRYNMHLCPKTLLIELGAQNNTLQEELNACEPLAHILNVVLSGTCE